LNIESLGDSKVCQSGIALFVEDNVLRLDVSMDDALAMKILKSQNHASNNELGLIFIIALVGQVIAHVAA
jgi:hypothetical protein